MYQATTHWPCTDHSDCFRRANEVLEDTAGEKIQRRSSSVAVANESKKGPTKFNHLEGDSGVIAFLTDMNIASLRDLRGEHIPLLREALQEGAVAMQEMSAKEQQGDAHPPVKMVAFVEYPPVCRPLHIVFRKEEIQAETREKRRFGPSALYLVEDILEKLGTGAGDFYAGACIVANYTGMAGMAKELVAHSHVVNASHPFRGKPPTSKTARSNATGRKTRWLAEARPAAPLKKASNVHVIRPGVGGASRTWKKVVDLFLTETSLQFRDGDQGCEYSLDDIYAARMDKDDNHNLVMYGAAISSLTEPLPVCPCVGRLTPTSSHCLVVTTLTPKSLGRIFAVSVTMLSSSFKRFLRQRNGNWHCNGLLRLAESELAKCQVASC